METRIRRWLDDKNELKLSYNFYLKNKIVKKVESRDILINSHLNKAEYNIKYVYYLYQNKIFLDWAVVGLYYAVYHSSLALLIKKGFMSKNHNATLCFLIYYFSEFGIDEIELFEDLILKEEEVKFYSLIKEDRQKASYSTKFGFSLEDVKELRLRSLSYIKKVQRILESFG